jgi:hypothetical protein
MVIGASDFVIAHAQPRAIASRLFSYHCSGPEVRRAGRELQIAAETNIARQQRQEEAFGLFKTEGGLQTSGKGELSKLCGNETARCAGNS